MGARLLIRFPSSSPQRFLYTCHICEIAAILAHEVPSTVSARVLAALFFLSPGSPTVASDRLALSHSFVAGTLLLFTGGALRKLCYRTLGRLFTYQLGVLKDHALVTTGPYAVVRHPAYAGLLLAHIGLVLVQLSPGSFIYECGILTRWWGALGFSLWGVWVALMLVSTLARPAKEDEVLRRVFGKEWEEWARRTPYRMIPYIY